MKPCQIVSKSLITKTTTIGLSKGKVLVELNYTAVAHLVTVAPLVSQKVKVKGYIIC